MTDNHQLAQAYAALGWHVFPCVPHGMQYQTKDGMKVSDGKPPAIPGGFRNATSNPEQVARQFDKAAATFGAEPGIGFWPGQSGMLVLDIDIKDGKQGATTLQALQDAHGELPSTLTQYTPSGGWHLFFRLPDGVKIGQAWRNPEQGRGIDVRSSSGYVCMQGTVTASGEYSFSDWEPTEGEPPEVAMAPDWLLCLLSHVGDTSTSTKPASAATQAQTTATPTAAHERHAALIKAILSGDVYHDSLRDLAASFIGQGMHPGAAVTQLRALMESSGAVRDARWTARYIQIPELVRTAEAKFTPPARADFGLGTAPTREDFAQGMAEHAAPKTEPRFNLLKDADIDGMPDLEWLIHGIMPTKGMGAVFGPSGSGKSFVILDMACAIAEGRHWFGYRTTKTPIVYIVLEGAQGLKNRRRAWLKHNNRAALPDEIHFIVQPVNFMEGDVYELAEVLPPGCMTIVDTLNRAAPGADENASKDMGLILAATSAISRATGGLTVLVHHTGKNEDAGLRGHSSLKAALDGSIVVTRNGEARAWKADKSKDGPDGQSHPFKLEVVNLGFDKYGDTISSCVVTPDTSGKQYTKPLTPSQRSAIGTYCAACDEGLGLVSDSFEFLGLHLEAWRKVFYQLSPGDNEDSKRKAFNRARKDLIDNGLATVESDVYRITDLTAAIREGEFIEKTLLKNDSGTSGTKRDMSRTVPAQKPQNSGTSGTQPLGVSRCPAGIDPVQAKTELGKNGEKNPSFSGADEDEGEV